MRYQGRARRGFSLIELLVIIAVVLLLLGLLLPAIQKAREAMNGLICRNNLRQMGLAMHMYHEDMGRFPPGYLGGPPSGRGGTVSPRSIASRIRKFDLPGPPPEVPPANGPGWGWASYLLPYLEQDNLARQINYYSPVESPSNLNARITKLRIYTCPTDSETGVFTVYAEFDSRPLAKAATNSYAACYGWRGLIDSQSDAGTGVYFRNSAVRFADVGDGASNTFAIGERGAFFTQTPWAGVMTGGSARTTPGAPVYRSMIEPAPVMVMARIGNKYLNDPYSEPYDFFTPHRQVGHFLFVDGAVHGLRTTMDVTILGQLATRAGGEPVALDDF